MEKKSVREKIEEICNGRLPSLYDVATKIGFKKDPMECSQRSVCMRIGAAGGGEKILIYDNGQKYKNLRSCKCGDVVAMSIEFMDRFSNYSHNWTSFYKEWQDYYGSVQNMFVERHAASNFQEETRAYIPFTPERWETKPFGPTSNVSLKSYLQYIRCIDRDTLAEMCGFFNTIKDTKYGTHNGKDIVNIGFPLYRVGEDTPCGFEIKNVGYKRTAPGSDVSMGMWSATRANLQDVKRIFFFESAIDAISYVSVDRMKAAETGTPRKINLDTDLLVSCAGGPKIGQVVSLKKACPQAQVIAEFDLDRAGHKHDIILNNIWSNQTIQISNVNKREEKLFTAEKVCTEEGKKEIQDLKDAGWSSYFRKDGSTLMYRSNLVGHEVKFNGQTVNLGLDELTLPKLANSFRDYRIMIDREKPIRGNYIKVVNDQQVSVAVKDWNDRAIADKQQRRAGLQRSVEKIGVIKQHQQEKEAVEQAQRDAQIAKANERIQNKSGRKI